MTPCSNRRGTEMSTHTHVTYWAESSIVTYGPLPNDQATFQWYADRGLQIRKKTEVTERTDEIIIPAGDPIVHWNGAPIMVAKQRERVA